MPKVLRFRDFRASNNRGTADMNYRPIIGILFGIYGLASCADHKRPHVASSTQGSEEAKPDTDLRGSGASATQDSEDAKPDADLRERARLAFTGTVVSTSVAYQENFSTKPDGSPYQTGNALVSRPGMYYSANFSTILTDASTGNNYVAGAGRGDARINFVNPLSGKIVLTFKGKYNYNAVNAGYTQVTLWNSANEQLDPQAYGLHTSGGTPTIRYNVITPVSWGTSWHTFKYEIDTAATTNNIKITIDGSINPNITATSSRLLNGNLKAINLSASLLIDDISITGTETPTVVADLEHFYSNDFESYNAGDSITTPSSGFIVRANGFGPVTQGMTSKNNTKYVTGIQDGGSSTSNPISVISFVPIISSRLEISFRLRAPISAAQYNSFGIYSYDTPIFKLTNDYKGLGFNGVYYIRGIAPDDWADIKIVTYPELSTGNVEIFVNTLSAGRVTIPNLSTTKVNSIRFGAVMTIDNLDIAGVYAAPLQAITNTYNNVKELYDSSVTKVAALPETSQDDKLRKVAFQWALAQSKQMIDLGLQKYDERLIYGAQGILNDISTYYSDPAVTQKNAEPANLFPTITADCPYKNGIFTVSGYGTIVPSRIPAFGQHDVVIRFAYAFLHPQSPSYGNTSIMGSLLSLMYSNNVYNHNIFSTSEVQSYILFNRVYPNLILPAAKAKIEEGMRAWATSDQNLIKNMMASGDYAAGSWLNGDINSILSVGLKGVALNDQSMIDATNKALPLVYKTLLPDGATNYAGNATEVPTYHFVAIDAMAWYWLFTGNQKAYDFVANSVGYWPMNNNGRAEYYTAASWKYYWNGVAPSSPTVAALTKDSYNYKLAGAPTSLLASLLWRGGVPALKTFPDNYTLFDRNIIGPRAKYGKFNYALVTRDPGYGVYSKSSVTGGSARGLGSFFGMSISNDAAGGDLNAAAQEFMGSIKNGSSGYFLATGITSSVSMAKSVQGLSAKYSLTDRLVPLAGFENTQQWVTSRDRAIGMLSIKSTVNNQVNAVNAVAKFISGRRGVGIRKEFQVLDSNTYQYGAIKIRIADHNFGKVDYSYSNAYAFDPNPPYDGQKGTLTFKDSLSMNDSTVKRTYTAGTTYYYVVELIPETSTFSTIKKLNLGNGLIGFEYDDGIKKVVMIHNPSAAAVTGSYSNAPGYSQYSIHLGADGTIDRDKFGNMDNFLLKGSTSSGNSVSASTQAFSYTVPAGRHILHIGSNNADDHIAGFKFYENVFNGQ